MRVITDAGVTIEFGTVETAPTIGIVDYSKRVTDDFGVTTVVSRGFSRTMSVKVALPSDQVDRVQQQLAELRAAPATWIADDRFASLSILGFFKDLQFDMAFPPLSYFTLTVEGLASTDVPLDGAGEAAPAGLASTLQLLRPAVISDIALTASSVAENDAPEWEAGASYASGARVMKADTHRVYESLIPLNVGKDPAAADGTWLDIGPTNRWAMFDDALGTSTSAAGQIRVTIEAGFAEAVALIDVAATSVRVEAPGYDRTIMVGAGAVTFLDLPGRFAPVTVTIAGDGLVSVGTLLLGRLDGLGITEASPTAGITDFSRKVVDEFGEVTVTKRGFTKRMSARALIDTAALDLVASRVAAVRARPCLWIGQDGSDALTVFGFFKDFSVEVAENVSKLSLSIEGMSTAAKLKPIGSLVDWPDLADPTGTKPADNATNSADPQSPLGPAGTVEQHLTKVGKLSGAVEILADTPDPDKLLDGAQALVDGIENQGIAQLAEQLLNQGRQKRNEAAQHLDGLPMGVYVKRVERTSEEADAKLAESISIVKASGEAGDGLIAGLLDAQVFRMDQARYDDLGAEATAIANVRADAQFLVDGVERRNTGEIDRLEKASADASHAEAIVVAGVRAEMQLLVDGVQQRTLGEIERVERSSSDALQASASAVDAITARFENASATNAGDIRQLSAVVATEKNVTATTFAAIEADFDGRVKAQGARTDQVFASEAEARAQSLDKLRADIGTTIGDEAARYAAETQRLESNIVTKDGAQSTALQSTRAELVMESEGARALMEAVAQRSEQASINEQGARAASVEQVRAEVAGVAGEVLVQKEALVDLQGRVRAYLVLSVEAGTGRAIVSLEADDVEGSLIDFAANRLRFANPVNGKMMTAMQIVGSNIEIVNDLYLGTGCIIQRTATHMSVQGTGFGSRGQFLNWYGPLKADLSQCTEAEALSFQTIDGLAYLAKGQSEADLRNTKSNTDYGMTSVAVGPFVTNGKTRQYVVSLNYVASGTRWSAYQDEGPVTGTFVLERLRADGGWDQLGVGQLGGYVYDDGGNGGYASESEPARYSKSAAGTIEIADTSGGTDPIQLRARITAYSTPAVTGTAYQADTITQVLRLTSYEP